MQVHYNHILHTYSFRAVQYVAAFLAVSATVLAFDLKIKDSGHESFLLELTAPVNQLCRVENSSDSVNWFHGVDVWTGATLESIEIDPEGGEFQLQVVCYPATDAPGSEPFFAVFDEPLSSQEETNIVIGAFTDPMLDKFFWRVRLQDVPE